MSARTDSLPAGVGPLSGIRVIECGSLLAGPFCGQLLGDFGADVVKVEDPRHGDPMRQWGNAKVHGLSLHWPIIARNKKSVTANLRTAEGQDLVRKLAATADVLLENFRPGTLERWGLGFDELSSINPRLILVRVSGYGQDGPYAPRAGFGAIGEAMGGLRFITGDPDRPPARLGISIGDALAAVFATMGTLLALRARDRTGRGQVVDSAIYEAVLALMESLLPEWELAGYQRSRTGSILPGVAPTNVYPTMDGDEILIAANSNTVFTRLAQAMGRPELAADARFASHDARGRNLAEIDKEVGAWTVTMDADRLLQILHESGVPAGRIFQAKDMLSDPHFAARQAIVRLAHPILGEMPMQNVFPRLSETPGTVRCVGPDLGQHNDEIYSERLGLDASQLDALRAKGII